MALKGLGCIRQELVPPLVVLGLADLVLVTDFGDRLALEAFDHDQGFRLGIPLALLHG
jgi:hypothetical protein